MTPYYADELVTLYAGDCLDVLAELPDASVDAVVTDPPYGLEFMGKEWDAPWRATGAVLAHATERGGFQDGPSGGNPYSRSRVEYGRGDMAGFQSWCEQWATECLRVLKPGGHLLAFGGTRTWHRLACAVEDAGFEVRDSIGWMNGGPLAWVYASGFPKSRNVSRDLDHVRCRCGEGESAHVPAQGVPGVWAGMDSGDALPGDPEQDLFAGVRGPLDLAVEAGGSVATEVAAPDLPGVRGAIPPPADQAPRRQAPDMLPAVQGHPRHRPDAESGTEGAGRLDRGQPAFVPGEDDRGEQPGVEGWSDLPPGQGELHRPEVRPLPTGVAGHGEGGRVRDGAPAGDGPVDRATAAAVGSGEPHQPRSAGQPAGESGAVPVERGPQEGRGWPLCARCGKPEIPDGLGTALKPAFEPIVVARKPLAGTVAANVLAHGTGALNIDACRIGMSDEDRAKFLTGMEGWRRHGERHSDDGATKAAEVYGTYGLDANGPHDAGRWPANVALDESQAAELDRQSGTLHSQNPATRRSRSTAQGVTGMGTGTSTEYDDRGGASRFFYVAKAPTAERPRTFHPSCDCEDAWPTRTPSAARATGGTTEPGSSSTSRLGSATTAGQSPTDTRSTTSTETSSTTTPTTSSRSRQPSTSASTPGASCETANGGSPAESAESSSPPPSNTGTSAGRGGRSTAGVGPATSPEWSATSVCGSCGAPSRSEAHATVKPLDLMRWLVRLVTPPGGVVLDPFAGSGTTAEACVIEGFRCITVEREPSYLPLIVARLSKPIQPDLFGGAA